MPRPFKYQLQGIFKISRKLSYFETILMATEKKMPVNEYNPSAN